MTVKALICSTKVCNFEDDVPGDQKYAQLVINLDIEVRLTSFAISHQTGLSHKYVKHSAQFKQALN